MSRWADVFARLSEGSGTLEIMRRSASSSGRVSQNVKSVMAASLRSQPVSHAADVLAKSVVSDLPIPAAGHATTVWREAEEERATFGADNRATPAPAQPASGGSDTLDTTRHSVASESTVSQCGYSVTATLAPEASALAVRSAIAIRDAEEEYAAFEQEGKIPRAWAEGFASLDPDQPPYGLSLSSERWRTICVAIGDFVDHWGAEAVRLGWSAEDIFGADASRPEVTWLNSGPLWCVNGGRVIEIHADKIVFETAAGARQIATKRPPLRPRVLPWELAP
jgi:hypothetical protein